LRRDLATRGGSARGRAGSEAGEVREDLGRAGAGTMGRSPNTESRVSMEEVAVPLKEEEKETTSSVEHRR
jgi:hypothetical protein